MSGQIIFDILDYWHTGSGHGAGRRVDASVVRSPEGLPYIPGRTVKGLLRDVVWLTEEYGHLQQGTTVKLFGTPADVVRAAEKAEESGESKAEDRLRTTAGILRVSSATLSDAWKAYAKTPEGQALARAFVDELAQTALDDTGQVQEHSLRRIEVTIPMQLSAEWSVDADGEAREMTVSALKKALPLLRRFGLSRHRGLGRVQVSIQGEKDV